MSGKGGARRPGRVVPRRDVGLGLWGPTSPCFVPASRSRLRSPCPPIPGTRAPDVRSRLRGGDEGNVAEMNEGVLVWGAAVGGIQPWELRTWARAYGLELSVPCLVSRKWDQRKHRGGIEGEAPVIPGGPPWGAGMWVSEVEAPMLQHRQRVGTLPAGHGCGDTAGGSHVCCIRGSCGSLGPSDASVLSARKPRARCVASPWASVVPCDLVPSAWPGQDVDTVMLVMV